MESLPAEIWMTIFSYACTDDGSTGRSISLVSRWFWDTSRSIKHQSLVVKGVNQIAGIASMLERLPPELRRVQYLSVRVHHRDMNKRSISVEDGVILLGDRDARESECGVSAHTQSGIHDRSMVVLSHMLQMIAPQLRVLHLWLPISSPSRLLPSTLPSIIELRLTSNDMRGQHLDTRSVCTAPQRYPSLRRLRLGMLHHQHGLFGRIAKLAPGITHLHFCIPEHTHLYRELERALRVGDAGMDVEKENLLPETIQRISVQMGPTPNAGKYPAWASMRKTMRLNLEKVARQDKRVVLVRLGSEGASLSSGPET
ncbi:hypothetical protein BDN71DRAFT_1449082 [Pleurotus eryngii]|uniref:F-box domain-containing protein n=1 Tax=Pleurotus eryngii TaxID=5323 RepID=A0A9P5ZVB9_PLEER|nr:hypothetical protein BDN71DRAFT_1449082 [Pleurotus eryngii]